MEKQDVEKEKGNKESCWYKFIKGWIWLILALTITMFIIVTIDRCTFHNVVYKKAKTEVIKEMTKGIPVDSLCYSADSSVITICIHDTDIAENNFTKQLEYLEKSDSLLSSNSLTYLVTLIVALLAALLLFRAEADETSKEKIHKLKREAQKLEKDLSNLKKTSEDEIRQLNITGMELTSYYNHVKSYNYFLTPVESIYFLSIMISNATSTLSPSKSDKENENIVNEVGGSLCSRLDLICDSIKDSKIDYLTTDENNILKTYLDDGRSALKRSRGSVNSINYESLKTLINNNLNSVKNIIEMIDNVEIRDENKA